MAYWYLGLPSTVTNLINNMIEDIRTPLSSNSDAFRGISIDSQHSIEY